MVQQAIDRGAVSVEEIHEFVADLRFDVFDIGDLLHTRGASGARRANPTDCSMSRSTENTSSGNSRRLLRWWTRSHRRRS